MWQQADYVTNAVPTSFAPTVCYHTIKPFSIHVPEPVDLKGDRKIIVCTLAAPGNPTIIKPNIIRGKIHHEKAVRIKIRKGISKEHESRSQKQ
jgi:hypothetical protein